MAKRTEVNEADKFFVLHHLTTDPAELSKLMNLRVNVVRDLVAEMAPLVEPDKPPKVKLPTNAAIKTQDGKQMGVMLTDELREVKTAKEPTPDPPHIFRFDVE